MSTRLDQLLKFYEDEPNDPFNLYAVALEYQKTDLRKAAQMFELLLREHPQYVATYYHAAKLFEELNDRSRAIEVYERGIDIARNANELKALRELQSAYNELTFD